ncbi:MAG: hypothetical protein IPN72_21920 [Saprospiraceae bacterium]|nr:hypothetical protein [Saprospiraceae bacterium]
MDNSIWVLTDYTDLHRNSTERQRLIEYVKSSINPELRWQRSNMLHIRSS